jgi:hypothetical protein
MISLLIAAAAAAAQPAPAGAAPGVGAALATPVSKTCKSDHREDVVVCGKPGQPYRIDPLVLEANRAANARPPKPPVIADSVPTNSCIGGTSCEGGFIPLVGMALVAAEAVSLAAHGDDWRDAIRTQSDQYRLYQQAEAKRASERKIRIGISAASK